MYSVHCTWTCWWQVSSMYLTLNSFFFRLKLKILLTYYCTICYENLIFRQLSWRLFRNKWFSLFFLTITAQWILIARRNQMVITLWDGIPGLNAVEIFTVLLSFRYDTKSICTGCWTWYIQVTMFTELLVTNYFYYKSYSDWITLQALKTNKLIYFSCSNFSRVAFYKLCIICKRTEQNVLFYILWEIKKGNL